jgi:hypothetical protein
MRAFLIKSGEIIKINYNRAFITLYFKLTITTNIMYVGYFSPSLTYFPHFGHLCEGLIF